MAKTFRAPGLKPFSAKTTERRRQSEIKTYLAMAALYCRKKHQGPRTNWTDENGQVLRFFPGRPCPLCPDCLARAKRAVKRTNVCRHMAYKTFCHACPRPCHGHEAESIAMMRFSGPRLLLYHPILGIQFFSYLFRVLRRNKGGETDAENPQQQA